MILRRVREEGVKKRTVQRYKQLSDLYKKIKDDTDFKDAFNELLKYEENKKALDSRRLFLYFTQNGRCLYTGTPLDIKNLETYQIDHILPQAYIKDDSFTNLALVKSIENQRKSDSLLLNERIINKQKHFWTKLLESGLITKSKYNRLTRTRIDEDELSGFINRQLVETRQIILNVANLLKFNYPDTEVHSIKASLTHNLREKYFLPKVREINDYHHAHDAFISSFIGIYLEKRFPGRDNPFLAKKYREFLKKKEALSSKYGYFIDSIALDGIDIITGEVVWNSAEEIGYLKNAMGYSDCFITKKTEDPSSEFYNQTLLKKTPGIIQLKNEWKRDGKIILSTEKYGGYSSDNKAYYVVVKNTIGTDVNIQFLGIPTRIAKLNESKPDAIMEYLRKQIAEGTITILKDKIRKFQKISYENNDWYLISDTEVCNAKQLLLNEQYISDLYAFSKCVDDFDDNKISDIYNAISEKLKTYPCYKQVQKKVENSLNKFNQLSKADRLYVINQLLNITHANSINGNLKKLSLSETIGRLCNKNLKAEKIIFIDSSITGLQSYKYYFDSYGNKHVIR